MQYKNTSKSYLYGKRRAYYLLLTYTYINIDKQFNNYYLKYFKYFSLFRKFKIMIIYTMAKHFKFLQFIYFGITTR